MEFTAGGTHAPGGRTGVIKQNRSNYFIRMQYPEEYRMEETKIIIDDDEQHWNIS